MKQKDTARTKRKSNGQFAVALKQFRRNKTAMIGLIILVILIFACLNESWLTPYEFDATDIRNKFAPLSLEHPMGTDQLGRDILTRLLRGGQISLLIGIISILIGAGIGAALGCTAAYFGGVYETVVMRVMDILMSMPALLTAAAIATVLGTGIGKSIVAISLAQVAMQTRMMYSTALSIKNQEYLEAARACGASNLRMVFKYVLPNCLPTLIIQITMRFGNCITQIASLSFLGLGVTPPTPEWGYILNAGKEYIRSYWPIVIFPGLMITIALVCVNLIGDGLRDALDPKMKR